MAAAPGKAIRASYLSTGDVVDGPLVAVARHRERVHVLLRRAPAVLLVQQGRVDLAEEADQGTRGDSHTCGVQGAQGVIGVSGLGPVAAGL